MRAIGIDESVALLFPRSVTLGMVSIRANGMVPAAKVPTVVMLVVPGQVLRAVFSTRSTDNWDRT